MAAAIFKEHAPSWLLVGEFQPSDGEFYTLVILALVYLWRRRQNNGTGSLLRQPVFWMIAIFWTLGFQADRFWADWGMTAATVWLAMQFDGWMAEKWPADSGRRLLLCGLLAVAAFPGFDQRSQSALHPNQQESALDASDPALAGWLPEGDGIFYNADMAFFYNTFYKNPTGELALHPGLRAGADAGGGLENSARHATGHFDLASYQPWIKKCARRTAWRFRVPRRPRCRNWNGA
jgi:hypothetical protein